MRAPYPANRLHNQHPPPPASESRGQPNRAATGGSILDADSPAQGVKFARRNTADEILRSISSNRSNGLLEAINGNVQAAKRKAKGYQTKHNLKLMVYLIAGGVLDALPT